MDGYLIMYYALLCLSSYERTHVYLSDGSKLYDAGFCSVIISAVMLSSDHKEKFASALRMFWVTFTFARRSTNAGVVIRGSNRNLYASHRLPRPTRLGPVAALSSHCTPLQSRQQRPGIHRHIRGFQAVLPSCPWPATSLLLL